MKFCPYCGASLPGGAVSFCAECGKGLPKGKESPRPYKETKRKAPVSKPSHGRKRRKQAHRDAPTENPRTDWPHGQDESYDGYYDDIPTIDSERMGDRMNPELAKRIVLLITGAVGLIALAAVLMSLL